MEIKSKSIVTEELRKPLDKVHPMREKVGLIQQGLAVCEQQLEETLERNAILEADSALIAKIRKVVPEGTKNIHEYIQQLVLEKGDASESAQGANNNLAALKQSIDNEKKRVISEVNKVGNNNPFVVKEECVKIIAKSFNLTD